LPCWCRLARWRRAAASSATVARSRRSMGDKQVAHVATYAAPPMRRQPSSSLMLMASRDYRTRRERAERDENERSIGCASVTSGAFTAESEPGAPSPDRRPPAWS
jgi:hypothetical protein